MRKKGIKDHAGRKIQYNFPANYLIYPWKAQKQRKGNAYFITTLPVPVVVAR